MTRRTSQPSPNLPNTYLPDCAATADKIVQQVVEGYPDKTRQARKEAA